MFHVLKSLFSKLGDLFAYIFTGILILFITTTFLDIICSFSSGHPYPLSKHIWSSLLNLL